MYRQVTKVFFVQQMKRLENAFGTKVFSPERAERIWSAIEGLSEPWFEALINKMLDNNRQVPLPNEFREAARIEKNLWNMNTEIKGSCGPCDDGTIFADRENYRYVFKCSCPVGQKRKEKWPVWEGDVRFKLIHLHAHPLSSIQALSTNFKRVGESKGL